MNREDNLAISFRSDGNRITLFISLDAIATGQVPRKYMMEQTYTTNRLFNLPF